MNRNRLFAVGALGIFAAAVITGRDQMPRAVSQTYSAQAVATQRAQIAAANHGEFFGSATIDTDWRAEVVIKTRLDARKADTALVQFRPLRVEGTPTPIPVMKSTRLKRYLFASVFNTPPIFPAFATDLRTGTFRVKTKTPEIGTIVLSGVLPSENRTGYFTLSAGGQTARGALQMPSPNPTATPTAALESVPTATPTSTETAPR